MMPKDLKRTKWPQAFLTELDVTADDQEFLVNCGLPNLEADELCFFTEPKHTKCNTLDCYWIGTFGIFNDIPLVVRPKIPGIWTIDDKTSKPIMANSSARLFSRFVGIRHKYLLDFEAFIPNDLRFDFVTIIKKAMEEIDPEAMASETIWGQFMDDMSNHAVYIDI